MFSQTAQHVGINCAIVEADRGLCGECPPLLQICCSASAMTDVVLGHFGLLESTQETKTYEILNVFNVKFALAAALREHGSGCEVWLADQS